MKQYCRYCSYLVTGNGIYCNKLDKDISESNAKSANQCRFFEFLNSDAFWENEKGYRPRKPKKIQCDGQMNLFD